MTLDLSLNGFWLTTALLVPVSVLLALTVRNIAEGLRTVRRFEQEIRMYDRAIEIYSRLSMTAGTGDRPTVGDGLVIAATQHACGALDDHQYNQAKDRIINAG